jgi:tRNA (adenine22-N1)-methyltransferase
MPYLDTRLKAVARQITSKIHVDIGSDHGHLLVALLKSRRIERGIAIENKDQPFRNSQLSLTGLCCDVRLGDGLSVLRTNEADSLSICGMGGQSIVNILRAHPVRVPDRIVLQPNRRSDVVRRWAKLSGFRLVEETIVLGHWAYDVMTFEKSMSLDDPSYDGIDSELGLWFGPLNLKRNDPLFQERLEQEREYFGRMERLSPDSERRLAMIVRALVQVSSGPQGSADENI